MLIRCTFTASAMVVPLLLLKNTVCAEFRFVGCFSLFITLLAFFSVLMFRLNEQVNNMWRKRKAFLKWYSVALLVARENFLHVSVFHEQHVCGEHYMKMACTDFTHSVCKIYTQWRVICI